MDSTYQLPHWILVICGITSFFSILLSSIGIFLQLMNYRKPFEQRLIVRILIIVPLFAISCYSVLVNHYIGDVIEPIREIYEAFVIYTFYKLLVLMLGGERKIILMTLNKEPVSHPFPMSLILPKVNISHPQHFLMIKRCILQYVWVKPLLYLIIFISDLIGIYDVNDISTSSIFLWLGILYNMSVTMSLYTLAMFWKCLYDELSVFNPWRKFLCVKLIIFASYWQGIIIGGLNWLGVFNSEVIDSSDNNIGIQIQNGLLSFEMIFFAILHWKSFPYSDFTSDKIVDAARMKFWNSMKDFIRIGDLIHDLKITTMYGDNYNLRNFDAITDSKIYNKSDTFNQKIYQGLRISANGKKYWINVDSNENDNESVKSGNNNGINKLNRNEYTSEMFNEMSSSNNNNDTTPLLNVEHSPTKKGYLSNINELMLEPNGERFIDDEDFMKDEKLYKYVKRHYIPDETINYPVEYELNLTENSGRINKLRESVRSSSRMV